MTDHPKPRRRFARRPWGYRRLTVDLAFEDLQVQLVELRNELMERETTIHDLRTELTRNRAQNRYWKDRETFVEHEVDRAREHAQRLEEEARERAERIEREAQERALQVIDRICSQANGIVEHAREEAREVTGRFQQDARAEAERLQQLREVQHAIRHAMRNAVASFESGLRTIDGAASEPAIELMPAKLRVTGSAPDFGRQRAIDASHRFGSVPSVVPGLERVEEDSATEPHQPAAAAKRGCQAAD